MDSKFFNREKEADINKSVIASKFTNADEVLKSERVQSFEEGIKKGEIDVVTMEDIDDNFGGDFYKAEDIDKFQDQLEELIKKGQDTYLSQDEWDTLKSGREDVDSLLRKAIIVPKGKTQEYKEVFVHNVASE